jgi:hypothetical protein
MSHAGLDLRRRRLDVCLLSVHGGLVAEIAVPPDADGLRGLVRRVARDREPVRAVIESMNGAPFVHDTLEEHGWEVWSPMPGRSRAGAAGLQDRQDRRAPARRAFRARPGAGDLAA